MFANSKYFVYPTYVINFDYNKNLYIYNIT